MIISAPRGTYYFYLLRWRSNRARFPHLEGDGDTLAPRLSSQRPLPAWGVAQGEAPERARARYLGAGVHCHPEWRPATTRVGQPRSPQGSR